MDKNKTVVETSKLLAVNGGEHIYSLISDSEVENGHIGYVGDIVDGEGIEIRSFEVFDVDTINKRRVVLAANPEWDYDESRRTNQAMCNYSNEANVPFRAYGLALSGDVYGVTEGGIDKGSATEIEVGQYVTNAADSTKAHVVNESATVGRGFVGKIIGKVQRGLGWKTEGGKTYGRPSVTYLIEVLRNGFVD